MIIRHKIRPAGAIAAAFAALISAPAFGQAMLGHDYELESSPIRKGEKPVIPLDTGDPSLQRLARAS